MATRRVIEDSDDDGSDLSPLKSPAYSLLTDVADRDDHDYHLADDHAAPGPALPDGGPSGAQQASRSGSTDPAFFERVYQEQSRTVEPLGRATIPQTAAAPSNDASSGGRQSETRSSITDPTSKGGRRRTSGGAAAVADLTQVTTPGRPSRKAAAAADAAAAAVWDVPSSPATAGKGSSSKAATTYGKRKRAHASAGFATLEAGPAEAASSSLSSPVAKRPRAAAQASPRSPGAQLADELGLGGGNIQVAAGAGDDVDLVVIPRSGDRVQPSGAGSDATSAPGQTQIRETQNATIEVMLPQTLSSSQKQAYKVFTLSSEPSPEDDGSSLPNRIDYSDHKSSGITVAVSTPSHFASSRKVDSSHLPSTAEVPPPPSTIKKGRKRKSNPAPTSSPDIFAEDDARSSKKAKKFVYYDDSWEPKGAREDAAEYKQRSSRTRPTAAAEGLPDTQLPGALPDTQPFGTLPDTQPPGVLHAREMPGGLPDTQPPPPPLPPQGFANQTTEQNRPQDELTLDPPDRSRGQGADPILIMSSDQEAGPSRVPEKQAKPQKKRGRKKKGVAKPSEPAATPAELAAGDDVINALSAMQQTDAPAEIYAKTDAALVPALEIPVPEAPPKKKRGRPKADTTTQEVDQTVVAEAEAPLKKKRGRPKKSAAKVTEPTGKEEGATAAKQSGHATAPSPPTGAGDPAATRALSQVSDGNSQKKTCRASVESPEGANVTSGSRGASTGPAEKGKENGDLDGGSKNVSREATAAPPVAKPAGTTNGCSPAGPAGKVSYRVGLSRRSRIAPLLKSLRK
ncbi:hypothetical protein RB597_005967 [Gaeumannomyces tritici]